MSTTNEKISELRELLWQQREGELSGEGIARIEELVSEDAEVREFYLRYSNLCGGLYWANSDGEALVGPDRLAQAGLGDTEPPADSSTPMQTIPRAIVEGMKWPSHPVRFALTVSLLTCIVWYSFIAVILPSLRHREVGPDQPLVVAKLVRTVDGVWLDEASAIKDGDLLETGRYLDLKRGLAEIRFYSGVQVTLRGPCLFELESHDGGELFYGQATARAPSGVKGFTIHTPDLAIIDLGTEFGVDVEKNSNKVDVHVFSGKVEVARSEGDDPKNRRQLGKGEALHFNPKTDQMFVARETDPQRFVAPTREPEDDTLGDLPVTRSLGLWLAADMGVVCDEAGRVDCWQDLRVGDNQITEHARQIEADLRPAWITDAAGEMPSVRFTGSENLRTSLMNAGSDFTLFVVFCPGSGHGNFLNGGASPKVAFRYDKHAEALSVGAAGKKPQPMSVAAEDGLVLARYIHAHSQGYAQLSANGEGGKVHNPRPATDVLQWRFGLGPKGKANGELDIAEVLIYHDVLSPEELKKIEGYLSTKYDL